VRRNSIRGLSVLIVLSVFLCFYSVSLVYCYSYIEMSGIFRYDFDGRWRCGLDLTIVNDNPEPLLICWIYLNVTDVTFIDDTYEEPNSPINDTYAFGIFPYSSRTISYNLTEAGFDKEPKELHVDCQVLTDRGLLWGSQNIIPEFPSFLILPLFMIATLLAVIVFRRKRTR